MSDMLPSASIVELIQMLLAAIGVVLGFYRLWVSIENGLVITDTQSSDLRRVVAETQILGELFRLFQQGCLLAVGVVSVLLPPPHPDSVLAPPEQLQVFLVRLGLITLTVVMVLDSIVQELRRREFLARAWTVPDKQKREHDMNGLRADIQKGAEAAHAAYEEANTVNKKISDLNERLLERDEPTIAPLGEHMKAVPHHRLED